VDKVSALGSKRVRVAALCASLLLACEATHRAPPPPACANGACAGQLAPPASPARPNFCARDASADQIRTLFCDAEAPPEIHSLLELQALIGFDPNKQGYTPKEIMDGAYRSGGRARVNYVVALSHSTALSGHVVSALNPRLFLLSNELVVAYQRGVQRVEIAARTADKSRYNFYLLSFTQACNSAADGCKPGELFTPRVETDWQAVRVQDDEELKNTALDCRQCHARARETPGLLMRELKAPWTHFFEPLPDTPPPNPFPGVRSRDLVEDYMHAKGEEPYGNIPLKSMRTTGGIFLEGTAGEAQPLLFDAPKIEQERWPGGPETYADPPQASPTWEAAYAAFKRGEQLALPFVDNRVADAAKQAALIDAYTRFRNGALEAEALPDLSDIFPDDPLLRARIGLQTEPGASAQEALVQACGSCHNDVLDQAISRARFNIDVSRLDQHALELAIERIQLPRTAAGAMPPPEARQLDDDGRDAVIAYLRGQPGEDPLLQRAARLGMTGRPE
jgi:hypothetical protein